MEKILLVEDRPDCLQVAIEALSKLVTIVSASTYEEAMEHIGDVQGIITDLFLPAKIDFRAKYLPKIQAGCTRNVELLKQELTGDQDYDTWIRENIEKQEKQPARWSALVENPAGLAIASEAMKMNLPVVIVSQGDRHQGDLATVRSAAIVMREYFCSAWKDPLQNLLLNGNGVKDKHLQEIWTNAYDELKRRSGIPPKEWF